jgi:hypothetical protein
MTISEQGPGGARQTWGRLRAGPASYSNVTANSGKRLATRGAGVENPGAPLAGPAEQIGAIANRSFAFHARARVRATRARGAL